MAGNGSSEGMDKLKDVGQQVLKSAGGKAMSTVTDKLGGLTDKLEGIAGGGPIGKAVEEGGKAAAEGDSPILGGLKGAASGIKDKITGGGGGGKSGGGKATKSTNIVETIDVGVPVKVAYNQWTEFGAFPSFMKKVENVEAQDENKITFKAQIFLSHRTWEATILEQIPDERIVWRSKGQKGHVDGAVTFHEIGPNLTRILVVLEYYPQGLFEKTGNIWEAQGRRARAELRHFRRHVMTRTILNPDEVEGWRGTIEDGEVVESHEDAMEREQQEEQEQDDQEQDEYGDEGEDEEAPEDDESPEEDEAADEYDDEDEGDEGEDEEAPEDEYESDEEAPEDDEGEDEDEAADDEYEEEGEEEAPEDEYEDEPADEDEALDEEEPSEDDEAEEPADEDPEDEYEEEEEEEEPPARKSRRRRAS
jgi:uncharacterized membrane protein